ncbi:histidine--tRNA ligase [Anaerococcus sp. AGMB09787]|uniref:histidine--tRNA ligase n=1 Tax=Anaerococcus sp. AGMB09787 TaxID=2922869 RepID=UPI001FAEC900|nr:histidine--tRNA ligase [Anaerococcus sp. AGMB09787]
MNIVKPSTIAGVMELLPEDQVVFDDIKEKIAATFSKYQFLPIDTPLIEKNEILFAKGGGETEKQIFEIASDSKDMSLRFDLTVPLARYVAEHFQDLNFPFKRYHIGKVYRGERNQKGRYKEFYQCDIDIIGHNSLSIINDAILPRVILDVFSQIGLSDITFKINNRKLLNGFFQSLGIEDSTEVLRTIDKKDKIGIDKTYDLLAEILSADKAETIIDFINKDEANDQVLADLESFDSNDLFKEGLSELGLVYKYMKEFGVGDENIKIDLAITRGLDYYTGTVYETFINGHESIGSVCSGGRYDNLAQNFTKQNLPGVGMSIGLTRLFYKLQELGLIREISKGLTDYLIIPMDEKINSYAIEVLRILRDANKEADIYFEAGKFKKKMTYADKIGAKKVIILGEDELNSRQVSIKDMESGEQITRPIDKILE